MKHLTVVEFMAFDRQHQHTYLSEAPMMLHAIKIEVSKLCDTAVIKKISHWEGTLLNVEDFNNEKVNEL